MTSQEMRPPSIQQLGPHLGVELGFAMATADEEKDSRTRQEALEASAELLEALKSWPKGSAERLYLTTLRVAAVGLSHGLSTRVKTLVDIVRTKKKLYDNQLNEFVNSPIKGSLLTIGYRVLMMFGCGTFVYMVMRAIFAMPQLQKEAHLDANSGQPQWTSLAFAVSFALAAAFIKAWVSARTVKKLTKEFEDDVKAARTDFLEQARGQYEICAHTCAAAWTALTTETAPSTKAFERLLSSAMAQCHGDISGLLFENRDEPDKKPFWKKLAVWNYLRKKPAVAPDAAKATT